MNKKTEILTLTELFVCVKRKPLKVNEVRFPANVKALSS